MFCCKNRLLLTFGLRSERQVECAESAVFKKAEHLLNYNIFNVGTCQGALLFIRLNFYNKKLHSFIMLFLALDESYSRFAFIDDPNTPLMCVFLPFIPSLID